MQCPGKGLVRSKQGVTHTRSPDTCSVPLDEEIGNFLPPQISPTEVDLTTEKEGKKIQTSHTFTNDFTQQVFPMFHCKCCTMFQYKLQEVQDNLEQVMKRNDQLTNQLDKCVSNSLQGEELFLDLLHKRQQEIETLQFNLGEKNEEAEYYKALSEELRKACREPRID